MKNPLKKEDHTSLIVVIAAGAIVAGALAYLFLTDSGNEVVKSVKHRFKEKAKDLAADVISKKTGAKKKTVKKIADHVAK
jgi:gas vesicle protein